MGIFDLLQILDFFQLSRSGKIAVGIGVVTLLACMVISVFFDPRPAVRWILMGGMVGLILTGLAVALHGSISARG